VGGQIEAEGRERGRDSWGEAASPLPTSYGIWGSAVSSLAVLETEGDPQTHSECIESPENPAGVL